MVLYEAGNLHRQIHTDGRQLPKVNDKTPLDAAGHPLSDALHVTERFHRRDFGHLDYEITFDDPKMYTKPFTVKISHELLADTDIFETYPENEKDRAHMCKR